jgi:DNA (cytosine-5)-methyltransferase 1
MIALRGPSISLDLGYVLHSLRRSTRSVEFAIDDLLGSVGNSEFDSPSKLSTDNQKRVNLLHENDWDDLPNEERPKCQQSEHTYQSVYGRMRKGEPSGTITTGFLTPGRGRFVHPTQKRGLTPHEGARIQGFPDSFRFEMADGSMPSRKTLCKVIGDAVPPRLGEVVTLAALAAGSVIENSLGESAFQGEDAIRQSA